MASELPNELRLEAHPCDLRLAKDESRVAIALSALEGNIWNGSVLIVDAETFLDPLRIEIRHGVGGIAWTDDNRVVLGDDSGLVQIWDKAPIRLGSHDDVVTTVSAGNVHGKSVVASGSWDCMIRVWDSEVGTSIAEIDGHGAGVSCCACGEDGLLSVGFDGTLQRWDWREKDVRRSGLVVASGPLHACSWSVEEKGMVAVGADDGSVQVWDVRSWKKPVFEARNHRGPVRRVVFREGAIVSGGDDGTVWQLALDGSAKEKLKDDGEYIRGLVYHKPTSSVLAASWKDHVFRI